MTEYVVRRLLIDLEQPFERLWNGGDAFRTAFFNALSMSFPVGEQFFIDSVRAGVDVLPPAERQRFAIEVKGFIAKRQPIAGFTVCLTNTCSARAIEITGRPELSSATRAWLAWIRVIR